RCSPRARALLATGPPVHDDGAMGDKEGPADPTGRRITEERADRLRFVKDAVAQGIPTAMLAGYLWWLWLGGRALRTNEALLTDFTRFARAAARYVAGAWPLWRADGGLGAPWLADATQSAAYPPALAVAAVFRPDVAHDLLIFAHLWLLGLVTYLLLRAYGLHRATAVAGAVLVQYGPLPAAAVADLNGLMTLPWTVATLWAAERAVQTEGLRWPAAAAVLAAVGMLAGAPDLAIAGAGLAVLLLLARAALETGRRPRALATLAVVLVGGAGLSAFQWIPALALDPDRLWNLLSATPSPALPPLSLLPIALALAAVASPRRRTAPPWLVLAAASGGALFWGIEIRAVAWILSLALGVAATLGLEVLREREWNPPNRVMGLIALGAFALAAAYHLPRIYGAALGVGGYPRETLHDNALDLAVMLCAFIAVVGLPRGKFKGGWFGATLALLAFVGVARPTYPWYARGGLPARADAASTTAWGELAAVVADREVWGRVLTDAAPAEALAARGLPAVTADSGPFPLSLTQDDFLASDGALQVAGIRYLLTPWKEPPPPETPKQVVTRAKPAARSASAEEVAPEEPERLSEIWSDGRHRLLKYAGATPRAFVVGGRRCFPTDSALSRAVLGSAFQPTHYVYAVGCADVAAGAVGATRVTRDAPGAIDVSVRAPEGGQLVVLERAAPGWSARVDDEGVEPYAAYGAVLGIGLAPGDHAVALRYRAPGFVLGLVLSVLTALGLSAWPAARRWRERRSGTRANDSIGHANTVIPTEGPKGRSGGISSG
ncbi:MAG: YfhO family protein, partial [Myxococcales bacterium]|nr:YfhO family protein [Myxococcales bacterium]